MDANEALTLYFAGAIDLTDEQLVAILPEQTETLAEFVARLESGEPLVFSDELRAAAKDAIARHEERARAEAVCLGLEAKA